MCVAEDFCASPDPDIIFDRNGFSLKRLAADRDSHIIEAMVERGYDDMGSYTYIVADTDAAVPEEDCIVVKGDVSPDLDAATLRIDYYAAAGRYLVADAYLALSPAEPGKVQHLWPPSDG
jgi:hypothetical protein